MKKEIDDALYQIFGGNYDENANHIELLYDDI